MDSDVQFALLDRLEKMGIAMADIAQALRAIARAIRKPDEEVRPWTDK